MSLDIAFPLTATDEARRQVEICNACRYCEGYCSVFPAMFKERAFTDADLTQLANLCHNCRGCYHACQYTAPHEFDLNLPRVLAEVRAESWERFAWPGAFAGMFHRSGVALGLALIAALAGLFWAISTLRPASGDGFYAALAHGTMVAIFLPAFLLPVLAFAVGLRRYWRETGGSRVTLAQLTSALRDAARMKNLGGGQGQGCNYEQGDRFSNARRLAHQAMMWGFLLCFASTSSGTVMHYGLGMEAPYGPFAVPKLLGVPGGLLMVIGGAGLVALKLKAERHLGAPELWGGEMAFVLILTLTALTGLALYAATGTTLVPGLLAVHLGTVLAFFLTAPYSKMAHGVYRMAALVRDAQGRTP